MTLFWSSSGCLFKFQLDWPVVFAELWQSPGEYSPLCGWLQISLIFMWALLLPIKIIILYLQIIWVKFHPSTVWICPRNTKTYITKPKVRGVTDQTEFNQVVAVTLLCQELHLGMGNGAGDPHVSDLIQSGTHLPCSFLFKLSEFSQASLSVKLLNFNFL